MLESELRMKCIPLLLSGLLAGAAFAQCEPYVPPGEPGPATGGGGSGPGGGRPWGGPGDTVPTGPGTGAPRQPKVTGPIEVPKSTGPTTGQPSPSAPMPTRPTTGGPTGPATPVPAPGLVPGRTGPRGMPLEDDETTWPRWWDLNGDDFLGQGLANTPQTGADTFYLGTRRREQGGRRRLPDARVIETSVLPALRAALAGSNDRELGAACLLALARIGAQRAPFALGEVFVAYLTAPDQVVRETAALALGLAGGRDGYRQSLLASLAADDEVGRRLAGGPVRERTRAFAAYGLGLAANATDSVAAKERAFAALAALLEVDAGREVKVAALHAIGLLQLDGRAYGEVRLQQQALETLADFLRRDVVGTERIVQAHCPTAMARLLPRGSALARRYAAVFAAELAGRSRTERHDHMVAQSCALALGRIVAADGAADDTDAPFRQTLLDTWRGHKDPQTRYFAMLALGRIGGDGTRELLLREFDRANRTQQKPWCALALGLLAHERAVPDRLLVDTLTAALRANKEPGLCGALAVALGLARATEAAPLLRERLLANQQQDQLAAHLCDALALLGDGQSVGVLRQVLDGAKRRPELLEAAATALGRLGDGEVGSRLAAMLAADGSHEERAAAARALALVGDERVLPALLATLASPAAADGVRAHAATVLGAIADARQKPWCQPLASDANYRAAVATLTDRSSGVLDRR